MKKAEAIEKMNWLGKLNLPFFFMVDFEMQHCIVLQPPEIKQSEILFDINGIKNYQKNCSLLPNDISFSKKPISFAGYAQKFDIVRKNLLKGNSFLLNLTCQTPIDINLSLRNLFYHATTKYKVWFKQELTFFSPETFVRIKNGKIYSYPMKGTINAKEPEAERKILENTKELAEHATIVDLIRNDLSIMNTKVRVTKFRYIDYILTNENRLIQTSSEIEAQLPANYCRQIGQILFSMLPAGSVSGAPKLKTIEIIQQAEAQKRGYYTGVSGYFDGKNMDSCVIIRFVENLGGHYFYRSGGGITFLSNAQDEYQEMLNKIYLPVLG